MDGSTCTMAHSSSSPATVTSFGLLQDKMRTFFHALSKLTKQSRKLTNSYVQEHNMISNPVAFSHIAEKARTKAKSLGLTLEFSDDSEKMYIFNNTVGRRRTCGINVGASAEEINHAMEWTANV